MADLFQEALNVLGSSAVSQVNTSQIIIDMQSALSYSFWGNGVREYLIAFLIFIVSVLALKIFKFVIVKRLEAFAETTKTQVDDVLIKMIDGIAWPFYVVLSLFIAFKFLHTSDLFDKVMNYVMVIIIAYQIVRAISVSIDFAIRNTIDKRQKSGEDADSSAADFLGKMIKFFLWVIAFIAVLSILGYNVSTLVAGLGIGGIAIAFALQNVLSDIFASFSIHFDKPFRTGDVVIIGTDVGTVEKIGLKSTRIRTIQGEELVVSNQELTTVRVRNMKQMQLRRVVFSIGVTYDTSLKKVKKIPEIIKKIILATPGCAVDRIHFKQFGDFSLIYEIMYNINSRDMNVYLDAQQQINFAIKEAFEKEKINFAYPTQVVYVNKGN